MDLSGPGIDVKLKERKKESYCLNDPIQKQKPSPIKSVYCLQFNVSLGPESPLVKICVGRTLAIAVTLKKLKRKKALSYNIYNIYKAAYIMDESPS
jgi:hypothetical protein